MKEQPNCATLSQMLPRVTTGRRYSRFSPSIRKQPQKADGEIPHLYDVTLLHWPCDVITLTGFERVTDEKGLKQPVHAQTSVLRQVGTE